MRTAYDPPFEITVLCRKCGAPCAGVSFFGADQQAAVVVDGEIVDPGGIRIAIYQLEEERRRSSFSQEPRAIHGGPLRTAPAVIVARCDRCRRKVGIIRVEIVSARANTKSTIRA